MVEALRKKMEVKTGRVMLSLIEKGALKGEKNIDALSNAVLDDGSNILNTAFDHASAVMRAAGWLPPKKKQGKKQKN